MFKEDDSEYSSHDEQADEVPSAAASHQTSKKEAAEDEDWLGSSSDDENELITKQRQIVTAQADFLRELRDDDEHEKVTLLPDLDAPAVDYDEVEERVKAIILTLENMKTLGDQGVSRHECLERMIQDLMLLYGYNRFLLEKIISLMKIGEVLEFIKANDHERPRVIRTNTLKTSRKELQRVLNERGVRLDTLEGGWSKLGMIVYDAQVPLGSTPEYLAGHYMLQSPSSFMPVMALAPKPGMRVLDMCAAPGGKTTHMAQLMNNQGVIIANDINKDRAQSLIANIHRLGVFNTIVVNYQGTAFPTLMGAFDRVLLDAPCSGTGVIARDPTVKNTKSEADLQMLTKNQKELILAAFDSVTAGGGGELCYCTCSVLVEENEEVVDYLLRKRSAARCVPPKRLDKGLDEALTKGIKRYQGKIFDDSIVNCRRVYPHKMNMDGFFFAMIEVLPHKIDASQRPVDVPKGKPDTRTKKQKKFSKRMKGK